MSGIDGLAIVTCIAAGTIGGVFFAFSTFVMQALGELPPAHGIAAMQRINRVVINPLFLGVFFAGALLSAGCILAAFVVVDPLRALLLLAAGFAYLGGCFLVTIACNVPRNERLAAVEPASADGAAYWVTYLHEWTRWNHVRTIAPLVAVGCSAASVAV